MAVNHFANPEFRTALAHVLSELEAPARIEMVLRAVDELPGDNEPMSLNPDPGSDAANTVSEGGQ